MELQSSLSGNDEHRRHAALLHKLSETSSQLTHLARETSSLRRDVVADIKAELRQGIAPVQPRYAVNSSDSNPFGGEKLSGSPPAHFQTDWVKVALLIVALAEFLFGLIYLVYAHWPF